MQIHGFVPYRDHKSWLQKGSICTLRYESRIHIVLWFTNPNLERFVLYRTYESSQFSKDLNPMNPNESSWILTNPHKSSQILVHRCILNKYEPIWILCFWFANPYGIQKIRIVDSLRRPVFKRFVLRIWLVRPKISKYLICIN